MVTALPLQRSRYSVTIIVVPLQHYHYNVKVTALPLQHNCYSITVTALKLQCYRFSVMVTALPLQRYPYSLTITVLPLPHFHYSFTITQLPLHLYCNTYVQSKLKLGRNPFDPMLLSFHLQLFAEMWCLICYMTPHNSQNFMHLFAQNPRLPPIKLSLWWLSICRCKYLHKIHHLFTVIVSGGGKDRE